MKDQITRGFCMYCLRPIALNGAVVYDHGFDLDYGYRNGICRGAGKVPANGNPEACAETLATLAADADKLEAAGAGEFRGVFTKRRGVLVWVGAEEIPADKMPAMLLNHQREHEAQIKGVRDLRAYLEKHYPQHIEAPLIIEARAEKPAAINYGDRKTNAKGNLCVAEGRDGQMVYYIEHRAEGKRRFKMTGRAWRALQDAPAAAAQ